MEKFVDEFTFQRDHLRRFPSILKEAAEVAGSIKCAWDLHRSDCNENQSFTESLYDGSN